MKKAFAMLLILIVLLTACTASPAESVQVQNVSQTSNTTGIETSSQGETAAQVVKSAQSAVQALAENSQPDSNLADATYDAANVVTIALNGDDISVSGKGVVVSGSRATITAAGTYSLSGTLNDGQIIVDTQDKEVVRLVLNGADLRSSGNSPIDIENAEKVALLLADGTENSVADGANYVFAGANETEPNAAIFSKASLTIAGEGSLTVSGNYNDGIAGKDGLLIASGSVTVNAVDDGIRGKDYVVVQGGTVTVNAQGDGLKADNAEDAAKGYVDISGGTLLIDAGGNAIQAETDVIVSDGSLSLAAGGGSSASSGDAKSTKGISAGVNVTIDGGVFAINTADDAINANANIVVNGGAFTIATGDDAMHANTSLEINSGEIRVSQSYEGLESALITINDGDIQIVSSDDGINVAGGMDSSGMGGRPGDMFATATGYYLYIHGGTILVEASGDGLDINGAIAMTGGTVLVNGPTNEGNGALDYDAGFNLTGGYLVAAGSSGMAMAPDTSSSQNSVMVFFTGTQAGGTLVHIQNSAGEELLTYAPTKQFQSIAFSSPDLASGETYTISLGGSSTGTQLGSLYQGGNYTGGSEYDSFTVSSAVTTVGTGGGGGMRGGGPGGGPRRP